MYKSINLGGLEADLKGGSGGAAASPSEKKLLKSMLKQWPEWQKMDELQGPRESDKNPPPPFREPPGCEAYWAS